MTEHDISEDAAPEQSPACPKCAGQMWDNRASKRNPKAPDYKCKTDGCDGIIWPPREAGVGAATTAAKPAGTPDDPACPVCGGKMWDDRVSKRNPRAPDFKCRNKPRAQGAPGCEGVIWPPRDGERRPAAKTGAPPTRGGAAPPRTSPQASPRNAPPPPAGPAREFTDDEVPDFDRDDDDLPF